ncbi:MAG: phosphohistidine phosphatase SixA [Pseudomonadales bacterium]
MRLIIVRHGEAEAFAGAASDAARQLTATGRSDVERLGEWLAGCSFEIQRIAASPYVRAEQTAALLASKLGHTDLVAIESGLQPDESPGAVIERLAVKSFDTVVLVSHQPLVGRLLNLLVDRNTLPVFMPACCAVVEADVVAPTCAHLVSFMSPEDK